MRHPDQLVLVLPNDTVSRLDLGYTPFHWHSSSEFHAHGGFWIAEPWAGDRHKSVGHNKRYLEARAPYDRLQQLLIPNSEKWIEAKCVAALIPDKVGLKFSLQVNGTTLSTGLPESQRLHKLMRQRKMRFLVTTCQARIVGGGIMPDGRKRGYGIEFDIPALWEVDAIKRQRNKEKSQLFGTFVFSVIADHAKTKLFQLFENRCFKCGSKHSLEIDHHIPIVLGGHLVPSNLVALCSRCNNQKRDLPPSAFYSNEELTRLQPLLENQESIFSFNFNRDFWEKDREGYLLSLGIDASIVSEVLTNPSHRFYIPPPIPSSKAVGVIFTIDDDLIKQNFQESR